MGLDAKTVAFTVLALVAFASNSLLTRLALGAREIDAATFTLLRLASGALVLAFAVRVQSGTFEGLRRRGVLGPLALFGYAAPFSFAYLRIGAAVGALVLFGVVQLTMVGYGIFRGERPAPFAWFGLSLALLGLAILTVPAASRPNPFGVLLMATAGVAWGAYSLAGRTNAEPIAANAWSFLASSLLALLLLLVFHASVTATARGIGLALVSGGITSGLGYAVWYRALPRLSVTQAAVAQLSVPVIAALGAAVFLDETLGARFVTASAAVLGGVALVLAVRSRRPT
ncbi:MAG TPA: DMT family transporter [Polyangiaceae bacterium]|nr:DMT family transporter [Polyangiaceae bacterium]